MNLAWLVAVIEPDLLAERSHGTAASPDAELAKIMQGRIMRSVFDEEIADPSVRAIGNAVSGDADAVDTLVQALSSADVVQDEAKLTALTLIACALLTDREDSARSLLIIDDTLRSLNGDTPESKLCRALILQQRALRKNDVGESTAIDLEEVLYLVGQIQFDPYPELVLRTNAPHSSTAAIEHIIGALRSSAAGFDLGAASTDMGYVASDLDEDELVQFRLWLSSAYKNKLSRSAPVEYGPDLYFENLRLEIIGHRDVYRSRRELASMRIVRFMPSLPSAVAADSLQLLRLAGADAELRQLVDDLVLVGPVSPLLTDGRRVQARRTTDRSLRTGELIVLAAAAEVMTPSEAFETLQRVLSVIRGGGPTTAPLRWQADFSKDEEAWTAAAALAGAAGAAGAIARELLDYASSNRLEDIASDTAIARIIRKIEWAEVEGDVRQLWLDLALEHEMQTPSSPTVASIRSMLGVQSQLPLGDSNRSLNGLAERINHFLRTKQPVPDDIREPTMSAALSSLETAAAEAQGGTYARRVVRPAEIVAVLLAQSADQQAWDGLLSFLANPLVARSEKSRAFTVLSYERPYLAADVADRHRDGILAAVTMPDRWAFDSADNDPVFTPALNFAYAYGLTTEDEVTEKLGELASSPDAHFRRQAGRSIALIAANSISDRMLPIIIALSSDSDPSVRVTVARALSHLVQRQDIVGGIAVERLTHLLNSEGVYAPLNVLGHLASTSLSLDPPMNWLVSGCRSEESAL